MWERNRVTASNGQIETNSDRMCVTKGDRRTEIDRE